MRAVLRRSRNNCHKHPSVARPPLGFLPRAQPPDGGFDLTGPSAGFSRKRERRYGSGGGTSNTYTEIVPVAVPPRPSDTVYSK